MATIKERLVNLEVRLGNVQKVQFVILTAILGKAGIELLPSVLALVG